MSHYYGIFRLIQAYSEPCVTPPQIHNLSIFRALAYLEPGAYLKPCETLIRHIRKPAILISAVVVLFNHIQAYSEPRVTFAYAETWHIQNPVIFRTLTIFVNMGLNQDAIPSSIQNPVIFMKIGKPCVTREIQNPSILIILE